MIRRGVIGVHAIFTENACAYRLSSRTLNTVLQNEVAPSGRDFDRSPAMHSGRRLHLNADTVDRFTGGVQNTPQRLWRHVHHQTSLATPMLECLHDVPVWRQLRAVGSHIVYRSLDLVEHEHRWPSMMMDGLFVT